MAYKNKKKKSESYQFKNLEVNNEKNNYNIKNETYVLSVFLSWILIFGKSFH